MSPMFFKVAEKQLEGFLRFLSECECSEASHHEMVKNTSRQIESTASLAMPNMPLPTGPRLL